MVVPVNLSCNSEIKKDTKQVKPGTIFFYFYLPS